MGDSGDPRDPLPVATPVEALQYERRTAAGSAVDVVFAAITLAVGVGFSGVGATFVFLLGRYFVEAYRRSEFTAFLAMLLAIAAFVFLLAGVGVVRASWRVIAGRVDPAPPSIFDRTGESDTFSGCAVGLLAIGALLGAFAVSLIAFAMLWIAIASREFGGAINSALTLVGCVVVGFISVLLLRLRV